MLGGDAGNGPCALGWPSTCSFPAFKLETEGDPKGAAVLSVPNEELMRQRTYATRALKGR